MGTYAVDLNYDMAIIFWRPKGIIWWFNMKCHSIMTKFRQIKILVIRDCRYLKRVGVEALLGESMLLVVGF